MTNSVGNAREGEGSFGLGPRAPIPLVCLNFKVPLQVRQQFKILRPPTQHDETELAAALSMKNKEITICANPFPCNR